MLIVGGATATGKSDFAIELAKLGNGEIVSADSMQIYKHMDIGTAKISSEEMQNVPHHMLSIIEPNEEFSVAEYQQRAIKIINEIESRGKLPIIVGGTGLYINSLIYMLGFGEIEKDNSLREELNLELKTYGKEYLYEKLAGIDPKAAEAIHINNVKRIIRAIEIKLLSGKSITEDKDKEKERCYYKMYAFDTERSLLYKRINNRVDVMFENRLEDEVNDLLINHSVNFDNQSMQAIGYKEFKGYFDGEYSKEILINMIKQHSRNYAKRQYTWFKAYGDCKWLNLDENKEIATNIIQDYYKNKPIL